MKWFHSRPKFHQDYQEGSFNLQSTEGMSCHVIGLRGRRYRPNMNQRKIKSWNCAINLLVIAPQWDLYSYIAVLISHQVLLSPLQTGDHMIWQWWRTPLYIWILLLAQLDEASDFQELTNTHDDDQRVLTTVTAICKSNLTRSRCLAFWSTSRLWRCQVCKCFPCARQCSPPPVDVWMPCLVTQLSGDIIHLQPLDKRHRQYRECWRTQIQ